jgi:hypothetical protein
MVKRYRPPALELLRAAKIPIIWDVVDAWPQPRGNVWDREQAMQWLIEEVRALRPAGFVAATQRMREDLATFGLPTLYLPHHARTDLQPVPLRPTVQRIGYEGGHQYLGRWHDHAMRWCVRHGVELVIENEMSKTQYESLDIVLALRHDSGYPVRQWKSNVKLANAQAAGIPCVLSPEYGYIETATGGERFVNGVDEPDLLYQALDNLLPHQARVEARDPMMMGSAKLEILSRIYKTWLSSTKF